MPIIKSAKKRVNTSKKAAVRNSKTKRTLKTAVKAFHASLKSGAKKAGSLSKAHSEVDKAAKKGVMHKNKAARKKSQLARAAKAAGASTTSTKKKTTAAKKTSTAKSAPKKAAAKKPAAKKAPAKKPAAKKK
jgi:ribosomal protein S20